MTHSRQVVLDTDIGTDVDDLMALALLLGTPEVRLLGITTVYGDTRLRARIAKQVLRMTGADVPVHAGETQPLSGRQVWWAGHEGVQYPRLDEESYESDAAIDFLLKTIIDSPGEIDVIAIGPLTNIAQAIAADSRFAPSIGHLWVMGGAFASDEAEHNFLSDDVAARQVLSAGIPTTVSGLEVTRQVSIGATELERIGSSGVLGELLRDEVSQWWRFWGTEWNIPHDPVTVLTMTRPELFTFSDPTAVDIGVRENVGVSTIAARAGSVRVTTDLDPTAVSAHIVSGIVAACERQPTKECP